MFQGFFGFFVGSPGDFGGVLIFAPIRSSPPLEIQAPWVNMLVSERVETYGLVGGGVGGRDCGSTCPVSSVEIFQWINPASSSSPSLDIRSTAPPPG